MHLSSYSPCISIILLYLIKRTIKCSHNFESSVSLIISRVAPLARSSVVHQAFVWKQDSVAQPLVERGWENFSCCLMSSTQTYSMLSSVHFKSKRNVYKEKARISGEYDPDKFWWQWGELHLWYPPQQDTV